MRMRFKSQQFRRFAPPPPSGSRISCNSHIKRRVQDIHRRLCRSLRVRRRYAGQGGPQSPDAGLERLHLAQDDRPDAQRGNFWLAGDEGAEGGLGVWGQDPGYVCF